MTREGQLTILTIAQNESGNLRRCLGSVQSLEATHLVVDGGSTDGTPELATSLGAQVVTRPFEYAAKQYNFGLTQVSTPWCFVLDADEAIDEELAHSIAAVIDAGPSEYAAYECRRRNRFVTTWVNHGAWYPDRNVRLLRVGDAGYEDRPVHARVQAQGPIGTLSGHILHHTYTSVSHYIVKLNRFTDVEVRARYGDDHSRPASPELKGRLRHLWLRTPFKSLSRFIIDYFLRQGFRDGRVGFDIAVSAAFYEHIVGMKHRYGERPQGAVTPATPSAPGSTRYEAGTARDQQRGTQGDADGSLSSSPHDSTPAPPTRS